MLLTVFEGVDRVTLEFLGQMKKTNKEEKKGKRKCKFFLGFPWMSMTELS